MTSLPSTERFTDRVADYVRFRPGYLYDTRLHVGQVSG
ncbi:hypothetical protein MEBOL_007401 [Melittangium boletus DSM 14713]|uniref:Uncharacterized protein n=1 Tax=Melittangium boletus DSM 14713 TaxID=1294270 RepID=A0A250IRM4_9BACT|nr:hypothetical protein MEBOL_007401 [Melittangium boletus DSM 14713]